MRLLFFYFFYQMIATAWKVFKCEVFSGPYFPIFGLKIQSRYRKIRTRKNSVFGHFSGSEPFKNYEKCFLFHLKSSFRSRDIQIFLFSSSPLFLPVDHCFREWSKINLKVYDVTNCLNKNLKDNFWQLRDL